MTTINTTTKDIAEAPQKYCRIILTEDKTNWHRLVECKDGTLEYRMGAGKRKDATLRSFRTLVRSIVQAAKSHQLEYIALHVGPIGCPKLEAQGSEWFYRTLAENLTLAAYEFTKYRTKKTDQSKLQEVLVCGELTAAEKHHKGTSKNIVEQSSPYSIGRAFSAGLTVGHAANVTRDIANTSGVDMTPSKLATAAKTALKGTKATVKTLGAAEIKKLNMGLLEAVGKGASDGPKLIVIEYWGAGKPKKGDKNGAPVALIGKGITYDTGGLNVKPSGAMHEMHLDMSGGAAVIGAMQAIAKLELKKNVVAVIPAAENSISADSMRAGDIATSMSGKTVEILHTDAEGRLVLADAMTYAEKYYSPKVMLDAATLTGAALVALGQHTSAIMTKDAALQQTLTNLSEDSGDLVWPLPLWDEYKQSLKSSRADISNIATNFAKWGGCIEGGTFLSFFAPKKTPWAHIDIAPRMDSIPSDKLAKGAAGEPVRLLVKFVEQS